MRASSLLSLALAGCVAALPAARALGTSARRLSAVQALEQFTRAPDDARLLPIVTRHCRSGAYPDELLGPLAQRLKEKPQLGGVRALIRFRRLCAEGQLAADINSWLGNELWLQQPGLLIEALRLERPNPILLQEFATATPSGSLSGCGACRIEREDLYEKKSEALRSVSADDEGTLVERNRLAIALSQSIRI